MNDEPNLIHFPGADEAESPAPPEESPADATRKALLFGIDLGRYDADRSMEELAALAEAAGMQAVAEVLQKRSAPDPATAMGAGRLAEARLTAENLGATVAIFDGELSGSQLRNLENHLKMAVMDRTMLILEIFRSRATSREGKTQTELALLEYRLPRLSGLGTALSRQGGGGGGGGGARRGGGETMLEYDRRYIRSRISVLKRRLAALEKRRGETRRAREKSGVPLVALVGYTNVGKSSLVNALTGSDIGAADMLFATLDPTARKLVLPDGLAVVLIDTVGFVSRLPHGLVEAFKSTLEEAAYADLLLLVCDAADPEAQTQLDITAGVLGDIGVRADTPRITVYNKCDKVPGFVSFSAEALAVSARTGQGLPELQQAIGAALGARMRRLRVLLPYNQLALADILRSHGTVHTEDFREDGVYYDASVEAPRAHLFEPYLCYDDEDPGETT